jgi:K+-transporting ATPase ATPase C chain
MHQMRTFVRGQLRPAIAIIITMTVITGMAYPALVTAAAQLIFPEQANGSLIRDDEGVVLGSSLIGQGFSRQTYFWSRPSAAGAEGYDASASGGTNLGPTSAELIGRVSARSERLLEAHGDAAVPVDLVTASASGLDPHISSEAAAYQVERVATARGMDPDEVRDIVAEHTDEPLLAFLGQSRVNVLELNLDLDGRLP